MRHAPDESKLLADCRARAIELLEPTLPYELGLFGTAILLRARAYLCAGRA